MTLNLSFTFEDAVLQISDRRMINLINRAEFDDYANKVVVSDWDGGGFCMTFAGIGECVPYGKVDHWTHSILQTLYEDGTKKMDDVINEFRSKMDAAFRLMKGTRTQKRHAFVLAGWYNHPNGSKRPYLCLISNFHTMEKGESLQVLDKSLSGFNSFPFDGSGRRIVTGLFNDFNNRLDQEVLPITRAYKENKITREELILGIVEIVRVLAASPESRGTVGMHCLSVFWEQGTEKVATYHDADGSIDTFGPLYFGGGMSIKNIHGRGMRKETVFSTTGDKPSTLWADQLYKVKHE